MTLAIKESGCPCQLFSTSVELHNLLLNENSVRINLDSMPVTKLTSHRFGSLLNIALISIKSSLILSFLSLHSSLANSTWERIYSEGTASLAALAFRKLLVSLLFARHHLVWHSFVDPLHPLIRMLLDYLTNIKKLTLGSVRNRTRTASYSLKSLQTSDFFLQSVFFRLLCFKLSLSH